MNSSLRSNSVDTGNVEPDAQNSPRRSSTQTPQPRASFLPANHDRSVRVEENQEVKSSTDEQLATTHSPGTDPHRLTDNAGTGLISTSEGAIPVAFAQDIEDWPSVNGEEATLREEDREVEVEATATEQGKSQEQYDFSETRTTDDQRASINTQRSSRVSLQSTSYASEERFVPTMATPEGPRLTRNSDNSCFDEREKSRNKRLQTSSNRLRARDLRVLRDNFTEMGGTSKTFSQKRPVQETPGTTTYATAKRFNARQRMQEMEKRVTMNEDAQNVAGLEVANLMAYFREDANRRADAEEKRRREDLNERRETERKEREEREQT
ncbi:hypothetical protein F443_15453 [Phytophthora nicotianae P1569]|uniref:Uncharacterized protein n=1 Tax=Phytophthora nicotianae P1569 TaxID=1317065 RepID=V9EKA2_PHYNI|nr:hypothetical protein F443_15453 [Phytophthora nicotianae P1569]